MNAYHRPTLDVVQAQDLRLELVGDHGRPSPSAPPSAKAAAWCQGHRPREAVPQRAAEAAGEAVMVRRNGLGRLDFVSSRRMKILRSASRGDHRHERRQEKRRPPDPGTLMRYGSPTSLTEAPLAPRVVPPTQRRALVATPRLPAALQPRRARAGRPAVALPAVALPADPHRRPASGAVEQPVAFLFRADRVLLPPAARQEGAKLRPSRRAAACGSS